MAQLGIRKTAHPLPQQVHPAIAWTLLHERKASRDGTLQPRQVIFTLEVLRMHRHNGNVILLRQGIGSRIHVIADNFHHAGGHQENGLRLIFFHHFGKGSLHLFDTAEGYVVAVQYHRHAPSTKAAKVLGMNGHVLGIIGTFVCADDHNQAVLNSPNRHGCTHQGAVGSGEHGIRQGRNLLHAFHLTEGHHSLDQFFSVHVGMCSFHAV